MKITMLSEIDYAGSGHKLCEAINTYTEHDIKLFSGKYANPFGHPDNSKWNRREVQQRIDNSDIVHLKGDWPPYNGYLGLKIMHKPIVITVSGSFFRKKGCGGYAKYDIEAYKSATIRTAFTPDLLYSGFSDIWTPHPIDCVEVESTFERREPPLLLHMPSREEVKGTDFVYDIFSALKSEIDVETSIISKVPFAKALKMRQRATIFFDQFTVGFYGNSAIEAMQYGIPVATWIRPEAKQYLEGCPVITTEKKVQSWVKLILDVLGGDMKGSSINSKLWCMNKHSYQEAAKQWDGIYDIIAI